MTTELYANDWLDTDWSGWLSLDPSDDKIREFSTDPGFYRVRHADRDGLEYIGQTGRSTRGRVGALARNVYSEEMPDGLEYIGQTGRSTRGRVGALARNVYSEEMPYRDPHTAAPCLWAVRDRYGPEFEVSTATPSFATNDQDRKGFEEALIAIARREIGESPTANFGRIISGYSQSSYRSEGYVGGLLDEDETEPNAEPGRRPIPWKNVDDVIAPDWMGLNWSEPFRLENRLDPDLPEAGVYRIWYDGESPPLDYIGETSAFTGRLRRHKDTFGGEALVSVAAPDGVNAKHKRTEVETDLIGAHYFITGESPTTQFGN